MSKFEIKLGQIEFGKVSAEAEALLDEGRFLRKNHNDLFEIERRIDNGFIFVCGRKGTGKTASMEKIILEEHSEKNCGVLDLEKFNLTKIISGTDLNGENACVFWRWIFLCKFIHILNESHIIKKNSRMSKTITKISNQVEGYVSLNEQKVVSIREEYKGQLKTAQFNNLGNIVLGVHRIIDKENAHYSEILVPLEKIIIKLITEVDELRSQKFYVFLDKIDEKYKATENDKIVISSALKAARDLFYQFKSNKPSIKFYPVVLIREDILNQLSSHLDLIKIKNDYTTFMRWYEYVTENEDENPLKKLLNLRIHNSVKALTNKSGAKWEDIVYEPDFCSINKSSFKYLLDNTFYRPRDVIAVLKEVGRIGKFKNLIDRKTIDKSLISYYSSLIEEIKFELEIHVDHSEVPPIIQALKKVSKETSFKVNEFASYLNEKNIEYVLSLLKTLFTLGCVCVIDGGAASTRKSYWFHRSSESTFSKDDINEQSEFYTHSCFR